MKRVLVANRGEIAARIIRTLNRLGIESVAVFADPDLGAPHVSSATASVRLGPGPADQSYLNVAALLEAAAATGCDAIHPGYGFLSENAAFAEACATAGLAFIGPTPAQLRAFGLKHEARELAAAAGVPVVPGSDLLETIDDAVVAAAAIGYPVMLKSTGGGGGIGMSVCPDEDALRQDFDRVRRLAASNFGEAGLFVERYISSARHVEVQLFGDGTGRVLTLGERDCSMQRRNQKVVEETPAPGLRDDVRAALALAARRLAEQVAYQSAGTVEFVVDVVTQEFFFLEVNARLQVEHPVTEEVFGVDLVEWMVRLAGGDTAMFDEPMPAPRGHAIEVRVYAEDPARGYRPSPGLLTNVVFPDDLRVDGWVSAGTEVTAFYDPLLAKVISWGETRDAAIDRLVVGLRQSRIDGVETNLRHLIDVTTSEAFVTGAVSTRALDGIKHNSTGFEVLAPGSMTTVQDAPGRLGYWHVGVPPSGPMDDLSFQLGNRILGNPPGASGLELTVTGPTLRFDAALTVCLVGADMPATLRTVDGVEHHVQQWKPVDVPSGATLAIGTASGPGLRSYLLVRGGLDIPEHLGSTSTFTLGCFGGHGGRALRVGDVLRVNRSVPVDQPCALPAAQRPALTNTWDVAVLEGPHGAPEFFTPDDIDMLFATRWEVHYNSARTGVRLIGPKPTWARADGGEAGLHPSNIHDTPYAVGAIDFTGDMPIILGPDGPSLGGFVCPATVTMTDRWKLGQLRPGDTVRFVPISAIDAANAVETRRRELAEQNGMVAPAFHPTRDPAGGLLGHRVADGDLPAVTYRQSGDDNLLVEYGPMVLDLDLRLRVHLLANWLQHNGVSGIVDLTPGIRSLQLHVDPSVMSVPQALRVVQAAEAELGRLDDAVVPSRIVHMPLSWDDPSTRLAIEKYMQSVRDDAPWCPWNIEFIRRINGLPDVEAVKRTVFDASYLVLGLGDVYLGAPVATPVDPRHRLVTTKYNPARTWTPENAVGIGGAYLCIYGMEGPGGYQFVGRTVPVWSRFRHSGQFEQPWLLRFFDQIRWYPVTTEELTDLRADVVHGRHELRIETTTFARADHARFLAAAKPEIDAFRSVQQNAFATERAAWEAAGEFAAAEEAFGRTPEPVDDIEVPPGGTLVSSVLTASVWQVHVREGETVRAGETLVVLEAMKMETVITAPCDGRVHRVLARVGDQLPAGSPLVVLTS
jgi:urea carboxylase